MTTEPPKAIETALYSISEAAKILDVSRKTVYNAIKRSSKNGGIDAKRRRDNERLQITGKEILRYWRG